MAWLLLTKTVTTSTLSIRDENGGVYDAILPTKTKRRLYHTTTSSSTHHVHPHQK